MLQIVDKSPTQTTMLNFSDYSQAGVHHHPARADQPHVEGISGRPAGAVGRRGAYPKQVPQDPADRARRDVAPAAARRADRPDQRPARTGIGIDCSQIRPGPVSTAKWWPSSPM